MEKIDYFKIFLVSLLLIAIRGYRFGCGDHVTQFPTIVHLLNSQIYKTDLINQVLYPPYLKVGLHAVLFYIAGSLNISTEYLYFFVYFIVIYAFILANFLIFIQLNIKKQSIEIALLLLILFALYYPSISHFKIIVKYLVPYLFVVPICLSSIYFFLKRNFLVASLIISFALLVHQQIALILFGGMSFSVISYKIFFSDDEKTGCSEMFAWFAPFFIIFFAYFFFILYLGSHHGYPWFDPIYGRELLKMTKFRVPHHLLLSYAKVKHIVGFLLAIILTCYLSFFYLRKNKSVLRLSLVSVGLSFLVVAGLIFTEIYPLPVAFNLYLFRGDIYIRLIFFYILMVFLNEKFDFTLNVKTMAAIYMCSVIASLVLIFTFGKLRIHTPDNEVVRISRCIQEKTSSDAFILTPPDVQGVRLYSRRSILASWKAHGLFLRPGIAREWFNRMQLLCGLDSKFSCLGKGCKKVCAKNFDNFSPDYLLNIARNYDMDYLLVRKKKSFLLPSVCETKNFVLYRAKDASPEANATAIFESSILK